MLQKNCEIYSVINVYSPTNIMGASGQWCLISGYHFDVTFSKEDGLVTLKQIRNTSVWKCHKLHTIVLATSDTDMPYSVWTYFYFFKKSKFADILE
jgi:hypothetical protein